MNKVTLLDNINEFIEERLNESYTKTIHTKEYKETRDKCYAIFSNIKNIINNKKLMSYYEEILIDMCTMQLEQAYKTGFKDSLILFSDKKI